MSTTLTYGISYPDGSQQPNVPLSMQTTAESVDSALAKLPQGIQALDERTTSVAEQSALWVAQYIPSFTFKANRNYLIIWAGASATTVPNGGQLAQIQSCSTADASTATTGLTEMMGYDLNMAVSNNHYKFYVVRGISFTTDTTLQIKGTLSANAALECGTTWPAQLSITDMGALPMVFAN